MGGGTGTGGNQHVIMTLSHPWGETDEKIRIFPPCQVEDSTNEEYEPVIVFTKGAKGVWKRQSVGWASFFPSDGFVAWDDKNHEYAWHEVGTIDVPSALDPALVRGAATKAAAAVRAIAKPRRKRRTFLEWFTGKSGANDIPDFLRKDA